MGPDTRSDAVLALGCRAMTNTSLGGRPVGRPKAMTEMESYAVMALLDAGVAPAWIRDHLRWEAGSKPSLRTISRHRSKM